MLDRPDQGHASTKLALAAGITSRSQYSSITLRPTFHDLVAFESGYLKNSQIEMLTAELRTYFPQDELKLHQFKLVDAISISPLSKMQKDLSWRLKLNWGTETDPNCFYCNHLNFNYGNGLALENTIFNNDALFLFLQITSQVNWTLSEKLLLGPSLFGGWLLKPVKRLHVLLTAQYDYFLIEKVIDRLSVQSSVNFVLAKDLELRLSGESIDRHLEGELALGWYF